MVGPVPESERAAFMRMLKVGVALLVGASTGLVAIQTDASLLQVGAATAIGLVVGGALAWYVVPSRSPLAERRSRQVRENPFRNDGSGGNKPDSEVASDAEGGDSHDERVRR